MARYVGLISVVLSLTFLTPVPAVAGAQGQPRGELHYAVQRGDIAKVRSLISDGADVNAEEGGFTPLFHAAEKGQTEIATALIAGGAKVNATDASGNTPLHFAAFKGHYAVCELLLAKGADASAKNVMGRTALAMARAGGHNQIVQLLSGRNVASGTSARAGAGTGVLQSPTSGTEYLAELNRLGIAGRPESDNAAPYIQRAIESYNEKPAALGQSNSGRPKELSAEERVLLRQWVQANTTALDQLRLASQKPYYWFKYSAETLQTDSGRLAGIRKLAFALEARVMLQVEQGNMPGALTDLATLYKVGALTAAGPKSLVEKLVGNAVKALALKAAFYIADQETLDVGSLKTVQSQLEALLAADEQAFDLRGEKLVTQYAVETNPAGQVLRGHVEGAFARLEAVVRKTPWELHNEKVDLAQDENLYVKQAGPGIVRAVELAYRSRAETQALITTLAVLRYKAERGAYPATLAALVSAGYIKEAPKDPFSDNLLVYRQTGQAFKLYSFGADFDDDGGTFSKWGRGEQGGDQVFWPVKGPAAADAQRPTGRTGTNEAATQELHMAVQRGDIKQVESALANNADINDKRGRQSWTPLHAAVWQTEKEIAELLIAQGADVNAKDNRGYTPLHYVAIKGASDLMNAILAKGADVNATDRAGHTPLCLAAQYGHKDVVELLIAKGADVNAQARNENALSLARKSRRNDIVELLLKHGAKEPVATAVGDRLYAGEEGPAGPGQHAGPQQQTPLQGGAATQSTTQVDIANILADPNEIKARIKTFEGLEKEIERVDRRSRLEIGQWLEERVDNREKLAKAVELQIRAELTCVRKVAVEEKAKKTTAAIDGLLAARQTRFRTLIKEMEEELKAQRPTRGRGSRGGRYGGRYSGGRTRYPQDGRVYGGQAEGRGAYADAGAMGMGRAPAAGGPATKEIPVSEWMQGPDSRTNLAQAVQEQVKTELTPIRQVAVEEQAEKTTAAIDGVLLSRQVRLDQLLIKMGGGPAGLPGRYPGAVQGTTETGAYPPRPRRR